MSNHDRILKIIALFGRARTPPQELLAGTRYMVCPIRYGFIQIDVPIANFDVKSAIRISTNPSLKMNSRALATKVRKRNKVPLTTLFTLWNLVVH
jgi:hypothetical protein